MPRNISFAFTTDQFKARTKTVTRRKGWKFLKPGDVLNACVKCMGLKPGEKLQHLGKIRVVRVARESLDALAESEVYGRNEAALEGFPDMTGEQFVAMYCEHLGGDEAQELTRIEFEYLE